MQVPEGAFAMSNFATFTALSRRAVVIMLRDRVRARADDGLRRGAARRGDIGVVAVPHVKPEVTASPWFFPPSFWASSTKKSMTYAAR